MRYPFGIFEHQSELTVDEGGDWFVARPLHWATASVQCLVLDGVEVALLLHVRPSQHGHGCASSSLPQPLYGGKLGRLIGERVAPMQIADQDLGRSQDQRHPHR
jgi:hypothetical protein